MKDDDKFLTLLELRKRLMLIDFNWLGLASLDRLRNEVEMEIERMKRGEKKLQK